MRKELHLQKHTICKVGIVGYGFISQFYLQALRKNPLFKVIGICDADKSREVAIKKAGFAYYEDFDAFIRMTNMNAIIIATPNHLHVDQTIKSLERGKHVLCEKPMAIHLEDAKKMVTTAKAVSRVLFVPFHHTYHRAVTQAKSRLKSDTEIVSFKAVNKENTLKFMNPADIGTTWYFQKKYSGGGCVIDMGINFVDLLYEFVGDMKIDTSKLVYGGQKTEVEARITFSFGDKGKGTLEVSAVAEKEERWIEFRTADGNRFTVNLLEDEPTYETGKLMTIEYEKVMEKFGEEIGKGTMHGERGLVIQKIVDEIYSKSQRQKSTVYKKGR